MSTAVSSRQRSPPIRLVLRLFLAHVAAAYATMVVLLVLVLMFDHHADGNLYRLVLTAPISVPLMVFDTHISSLGLMIVYAGYTAAFLATWFLQTRRPHPGPRGFPVQLPARQQHHE